jgi:hypothetical protein
MQELAVTAIIDSEISQANITSWPPFNFESGIKNKISSLKHIKNQNEVKRTMAEAQ